MDSLIRRTINYVSIGRADKLATYHVLDMLQKEFKVKVIKGIMVANGHRACTTKPTTPLAKSLVGDGLHKPLHSRGQHQYGIITHVDGGKAQQQKQQDRVDKRVAVMQTSMVGDFVERSVLQCQTSVEGCLTVSLQYGFAKNVAAFIAIQTVGPRVEQSRATPIFDSSIILRHLENYWAGGSKHRSIFSCKQFGGTPGLGLGLMENDARGSSPKIRPLQSYRAIVLWEELQGLVDKLSLFQPLEC
eukprot:Gb_06442 [translate_table: standard]